MSIITFYSIKGIVHFQFIPQGKIANVTQYVEMLKWVHEAVCRKRPDDQILHHDSDPANKVLSVKQFLAQKSITEVEYPPYTLNLALNNFWLLPKINSALKG
jgi:hypothetical protein